MVETLTIVFVADHLVNLVGLWTGSGLRSFAEDNTNDGLYFLSPACGRFGTCFALKFVP